jgi:hypothetical protein
MIQTFSLDQLSQAQSITEPKTIRIDSVNGVITVLTGVDYIAPTATPDLLGFQTAMLNYYGVEKMNALITRYPLLESLAAAEDYVNIRAIFELAIANGDISSADKAAFQASLDQFNIPITL